MALLERMFSIFVGSSSEGRPEAEVVAELIDEHAACRAIPWWDESVARPGDSFLEALFALLPVVNFAIFVATPDDLLVKREEVLASVRDNVLFEYGLFAGYLGRHHAVVLQIGNASEPSDLRGITMVRVAELGGVTKKERRSELRSAVSRCLDVLLQATEGGLVAALSEVRAAGDYVALSDLTRVLRLSVSRRLTGRMQSRLSAPQLKEILEKYRRGEKRIGRPNHRSTVRDYIDLGQISDDELKRVTACYARFVADHVVAANSENGATRIALHYKEDLALVSAVVADIGVSPALVDLEVRPPSRRVKGQFIRGDGAVFVHDFTATGFTPLTCISELAKYDIVTHDIVSFFAREETLSQIETACRSSNVRFHIFCVQNDSGDLEIRWA